MTHQEAAEALDRQTQRLLAGAPAEAEPGGLESLLQLARRLQAALVPVEARPVFVSQLKDKLLSGALTAAPERHAHRRLWWAAGAGGVLALAGLTFIGVRARRTERRAVSGIISASRAGQAPLPEPQATT